MWKAKQCTISEQIPARRVLYSVDRSVIGRWRQTYSYINEVPLTPRNLPFYITDVVCRYLRNTLTCFFCIQLARLFLEPTRCHRVARHIYLPRKEKSEKLVGSDKYVGIFQCDASLLCLHYSTLFGSNNLNCIIRVVQYIYKVAIISTSYLYYSSSFCVVKLTNRFPPCATILRCVL